MRALCFITLLLLHGNFAWSQWKVGALNPLLADLAKQVGGNRVEVINLMTKNGNIHNFKPTPRDLSQVTKCRVFLASGKGLESYLEKLQAIVGNKVEIYEVGRKLPSLQIGGNGVYACCPDHSKGGIDPHWWHSLKNWQRASKNVAKLFARIDPENAKEYNENATRFRSELGETYIWAKKKITEIPRGERNLATAHAAYGYFCREFSFKSIPIQGISQEKSASSQYLQKAIKVIKENKIKAIFPEKMANPKSLKTIANSTGAKLGGFLYADLHHSIIGMFKHNVKTIVESLK